MKLLSSIAVASLTLALAVPALADAAAAPGEARVSHAAEVHTSGELSRYIVGPAGHVRGFLLRDGTVVNLRPKAGDEMAKGVTVGQTVRVDGFGPMDNGKLVFRANVFGPHGQVATMPAWHEPAKTDEAGRARKREEWKKEHADELAKLSPVATQGTVQTVLTGHHGAPYAVLLSNGVNVFLSRPMAKELASRTVKTGDVIQVTGRGGTYPLGTSVLATSVTFADGTKLDAAMPQR